MGRALHFGRGIQKVFDSFFCLCIFSLDLCPFPDGSDFIRKIVHCRLFFFFADFSCSAALLAGFELLYWLVLSWILVILSCLLYCLILGLILARNSWPFRSLDLEETCWLLLVLFAGMLLYLFGRFFVIDCFFVHLWIQVVRN